MPAVEALSLCCKTSNSLNRYSPLLLQALPVSLLLLLLAVLQTRACMTLQHPVLATEMTLAEPAVTYDALCGFLAVLALALDLLGCTAAEGQSQVDCALS